jgi:Zn-dependent protease
MNPIQTLAIAALPLVFAITLHEAAHGYVARHFGDPTAWQLGRISLNPLRHIDPLGTLLLPAILVLVGAPVFGWAKPVPVDFSRLRHPKQDMFWVAAAGPAANLFMAVCWALVLKIVVSTPDFVFHQAMGEMSRYGITINAVLLFLNLLPLPPLDGGRIAVSLLPPRAAWNLARIEPFGIPILLALLVFGVLDTVLLPMVGKLLFLLKFLFGI